MDDKRIELLSLLSPGEAHAAKVDLLAVDLGVSKCDIERLACQLQALGFRVVCKRCRVWIDWPGWLHAKRVAEEHLARHLD